MFKKGDLIIYILISYMFFILSINAFKMPNIAGSKVEIYVNNVLKEVHNLVPDKKEVFVETDIGGINILFYNQGVEVVSSNSPRKLIMKQGFIHKAGQTLIGVPDKVLIKIIGNKQDDLDFILQ